MTVPTIEPIVIFPGRECYDDEGFHCSRDGAHKMHCIQCHQYAEDEMEKVLVGIYKHPK